MFLAVMLVMTMTVTAFAGTQQADLTYGGAVYTVYIRCNDDEAAANIRTLNGNATIAVSAVAADDIGQLYEEGAFNRTIEAKVVLEPHEHRTFDYAEARYIVNNNTIDVRKEYAP